jgi:hypothetical protein
MYQLALVLFSGKTYMADRYLLGLAPTAEVAEHPITPCAFRFRRVDVTASACDLASGPPAASTRWALALA